MAIGVFGLQVAYRLKRLEVMSIDDTHGWFAGGSTSATAGATPYVSSADRMDFSNDTGTSNIRGSLSLARGWLSATGNSNYGWFVGGHQAGVPITVFSTVDRIDFSNDSATASVRGSLDLRRTASGATGNSNYGWIGGGDITYPLGSNKLSSITRIDFSNDSGTPTLRGPLTLARNNLAATGNSNYGWWGGGYGVGPVTTIDRVDFSNDFSAASLRGSLPVAKNGTAATANSNYGWVFTGTVVFPTRTSSVNRIDFANDLISASVRGPLTSTRYLGSATGNSNYGWYGGGNLNPGATSSVDRINFANDSVTASVRGILSSNKHITGATSGQAKGPAIKLQKSGNYGWFGGGNLPGLTATVDRIDFSNDSPTALARGGLFTARDRLGATGNSNYGWFGGGNAVSVVDRIDFSSDSPTASLRGPLSQGRSWLGATGNSNYGYFAAGLGSGAPGPTYSTIDRIDFSNDSPTTRARGPLTSNKGISIATGNSNYGWFFGFVSIVSNIERINFSNDSVTASDRGKLSLARSYGGATGNSNYGWYAGGQTPAATPPIISRVDRIDFANDLATASVRGPLTGARYELSATGNSNYGWFGGGRTPATPTPTILATVERIDFSNDLAATSPRGALSAARYRLAATSNTPT